MVDKQLPWEAPFGMADEREEPAESDSGAHWYRVPLPPMFTSGTAWHYTSADGLIGIVSAGQVWASSPRAMNDLSEVQYGIEVLRAAFDDLDRDRIPAPCIEFLGYVLDYDMSIRMRSSLFVLSASLERDLLNQWVHYAGADGFAVGIDVGAEIRPFPPNGAVFQGWHRVVYGRQEQLRVATDLLEFVGAGTPGNAETWEERRADWPQIASGSRFLLQGLVPQFKDAAFADEREVRFIASRVAPERARFRSSSGRLVPFIPVGPGPTGRIAISEIVCGPSVRQGTAEVVRLLLDDNGFEDVPVTLSSIPYMNTTIRW